MMEEIYEVKYIDNCIVADLGADKLKICEGGEIYGSVRSGIYRVRGLYTSLCKYFRANITKDWIVDLFDNDFFAIKGEWVGITKNKYEVSVDIGEAQINYNKDGLVLWYEGLELYEELSVSLEEFINEVFAGEICQDVILEVKGTDIVFKAKWGEILRIGRRNLVIPNDFCLAYGKIKNPEEIYNWVYAIKQEMDYKEMRKGLLGVDLYIFTWGQWTISLVKEGRLYGIQWTDGKNAIEITEAMLWVKRKGKRKKIEIEGIFRQKGRISEIFFENDEFLKALIF